MDMGPIKPIQPYLEYLLFFHKEVVILQLHQNQTASYFVTAATT